MFAAKTRYLFHALIIFALALLITSPVHAQVLAAKDPYLEMDVSAAEKNANPGEQIRFEIKAEVKETATATNVVVINPIPADSSFVSATGGGVYDEPTDTVTWTFPLLVEGDEATFELTLRVDNSPADNKVTNSASMTSDENFEDTSKASDSDFVNIKDAPFIVLTKFTVVSLVQPGDDVTFEIDFANEGNKDAKNTLLTDVLPPFTTFVDATLGGVYDDATRTVSWPEDDIDEGTSGTVLVIVSIDADAPDGTVLTNTANIVGDGFESVSGNASVTVQAAPILELTKQADVSFVSPGEEITYFLEYSNSGNATATDVQLVDVLPADTSFVSASGGGTFDGTNVTWAEGTLSAGETGSVSMTVLVDAGVTPSTRATNGDVISNIATLSAGNATAVPVENRVPVVAIPLLELSKTASSEFIKAGTNVTYTISYTNSGTATAENVVLEDFIPEFTTFVTATGGGQLVDDKVVWTDPGLTPGAEGQVQLVLLIDDDLAEGQQVTNTASMTSDNSTPVASSSVVTVRNAPILEITKNSNVDFVQAGDEIVYTIEFTNTGNVDATTLTIEDLLPTGTTFVSASAEGVFANGRVTWTFPYLGVGQVGSVNLVVSVDADTVGASIQNSVTIDAANSLAASTTNTVFSESRPILKLEKEANLTFVEAGGQVTFTLSYANEGNVEASNVVLQDFLPANTSFVSAGGGGVYDPVENEVTWTDPTLPAGGSGQAQLTLQADASAPADLVISNSATITSDETTPVTAVGTVVVKRSADLFLKKTADVEIVSPGDLVIFTLEFGNGGNAAAEDVVLEDLIPDGTTFVSATGGGVLDAGQVSWNLGNLDVGEQGSVSLTFRIDADVSNGQYINNVATLDSTNAFAESATDSVVASLLPILSLSKTSNTEFVQPGNSITFSLYYENTGNTAATNIILTDQIPQYTTFVSATGGGALVDNEVVWTDPSFSAGTIGQVQITLLVDDDAPDNAVILNSASLSSDQTPPLTSSASVNVRRTPVLNLDKTASVELVDAGEEVTYTLDYSNTGNATARNLEILDPIPPNTTFVSATAGGVLSDGVVRWSASQLAPGDGGAVALTVRVSIDAENGQVITNSATADAENAFSALSSVNVLVQKRPVLTLTMTASNEFVEAGELAGFYLEATNTGNERANNVVIEDEIPAGATYESASPGGVYDQATNTVHWEIPSLAVGDRATVSINMRTDTGLADDTTITNNATVDSDKTQPVTASDTIRIKRSPQFTLSKDANVEFVGPGEQMTYTLDFENVGNADAVNAVLEDPVPATTSYVSSTGGGVLADGKVTWSFPTLAVGSPSSVTMTVQVDPAAIIDDIQALENGDIIYNTATLDGPDAYAVSAEDSVTVKLSPALSIDKTADSTVAIPGTEITYQLAIENTGNVPANNLLLQDTLPDDVSFVSASDGGTEAAGIVTWTLASLAVGESAEASLIVLVDSPLDDGTVIFNSSSLVSDETSPVSADHTLNVQSSPLLSLVKTADKTVVNPGDEITYTLQVDNTGNANTSGLLVDIIPDHTTFVSASDGGLAIGRTVSWYLPNILVGEPQIVTLTVLVDDPLPNNTLILNQAALVSDQVGPIVEEHQLYVTSSPLLTLAKTVDKTLVTPGTQLVYTLAYGNEGNANAVNTVLQDQIPANTSFVSASDGGALADGFVNWNIGALDAGTSGTVTLTVLVDTPLDNGTVIDNFASIQSDLGGPVVDSARSTVQSAPLLSVDNTPDVTLVEAGGQVVYTLDYSNTGTANATGVTLTDWLPANTTFVSASDGGSELNGVVNWPVTDTAAGDSGSVWLTVAVDSPLDNATTLFNIASIDSIEGQPDADTALVVVQSAPALTLNKTANVTQVQPGDQLTYTLNFSNTGNANAARYTLTDMVPANTTFVSSTGGGVEAAGTVTWSGINLLVGETHSVTMTVQVNSPLSNGTVISNQASLAAERAETVYDSVDITVQSSPILTLVKTVGTTLVQPGDQLTFTLNFNNTGNANASNIVLTDIVPANTTFVSASGSGTESGGVVTWTQAELLVGTPGSVTMTVQVNTPLDSGTVITNNAGLVSDQTTEVNDQASVIVQSAPVLNLTKTADKTVAVPGDTITYTLSLSNTGNANANNIVLQDTLPNNTTFVSASGGGTESGGVVTWTTPQLPVGTPAAVTLTVKLDTPLDNGTVIYNNATLNSDETSPVNADNTVTVQSTPVLTLSKTADKTVVNPGDTITYTLSLSNSGNANANNIVLEDTLPANTTFVSASAGGTEAGGVVTWTAAALPVGPGSSITLTVAVDTPLDNGTTIYNSATLDSNETDPISTDHTLTVQSAPILVLTKTADKSVVNPGDQITYTLALSNTGNANANNIVLQDTLPANTSFVSATGGGTESAGVVTWATPDLPVGPGGSVTVTVLVDSPLNDGTAIYNSATLQSDETGPVTADNTLSVQSAPLLNLSKTADKTVAIPGDTVTYTLSFSNTGNANVNNVVLEDTIPANTTFVSASGGGTELGGVVTWTTPQLPVGPGGSVTLSVLVKSPLDNGTSIYNSATLESDETAPVSTDHRLTVQSLPLLALTKTADKTFAEPGDTITYTLSLSNSGNANATNIVLQDTLPNNTTFVSASGGGVEKDGVITWTTPQLPVGPGGSVTLSVLVDTPLDNGTTIYNSATLNCDETAPVSAGHTLAIQSSPVLALSKTADKIVAKPGDTITYTLSVSNSGNANASNIVLEDTLPKDTTFVSASAGGVEVDGVVTWTAALLPVGPGGSVTLTVLVDTPLDDGTTIYNSATLDSDETAPVSANNTLTVQSAPVLVLTKTADKTVANPGDTITYTLSLSNSGNANANNIVLQDTLPANTSFVSATGGGYESSGVVTWTTPELPVGPGGSVTLTVLVDTPLDNGTSVYNSATLDSDETAPVSANITVTIQSTPLLRLDKSADKILVTPGETITYTLSLSNIGNANANNAVLQDTLPSNASFVSATGGGVEVGGIVTWTAAQLLVGAPASVTLTVLVDTPLDDGTYVHNSATLASDETAPVTANDTVTVQSAPVLTLAKTADKTVVNPGDTITYTLSLSNTGNANATDIVLQDTLPGHTSFVSASAGGLETDGVVTWTAPELLVGPGGSVTLTVLVDSPLDNGTSIYNSATLQSGETAPVSADNTLTVQSTPVLVLTKTADKTVVNPGDTITYTLSLSNTGNANASNIVLQDTLPDHTSFVSASGGGVEAGGVVSWTTPELPVGPGGSVTLTVLVDTPLDNGISLYNSATLDSDETAPVSDDVAVAVQSAPALNLSKTADRTVVSPGETITYTLSFANTGNANARNIILQDTLPDHTTFVSASAGGTMLDGVVIWTAPALPVGPGGSVTLTVKVVSPLDNGTVIYNSATLNSDDTTPISTDNTVTVQSAPVLALFKVADKIFAAPGDQIVYTLSFDNMGNANATNVLLSDTLPPDTTFLSATGGGVENAGTVTWPLFDMNAGSGGSVLLTVRVNSPLANATVLHNIADLDAGDQAPPATAPSEVIVQSAPAPGIAKMADVVVAEAGGLITYTIDYDNSGNDTLIGAQLIDDMPAGTTFVSASNGGVFDGSLVTWDIGQVGAGIGGSVSMTVEVLETVVDGDIINNTAAITGSNAAPVSTQLSIPVSGAAVLGLSKTAAQTNVLPGGQIDYTIEYSNMGNAVATGLTIQDPIPAFTQFVSASAGGALVSGVVIWSLPDLAPGAGGSVTLSIVVDADAPVNTSITNTATISADAAPPVSSGTSVVVDDPFTVIPVLKLELTPDREEIAPGESVLYTVDYSNVVAVDAIDVEIIALLPGNVVFENASDGGAFETDGNLTWVRWQQTILPGNTSNQVTYLVRHQSNVPIANSNPSGTNVEKINALASVTASNALPVTSGFDTATVTVRPSLQPPGETVSVPATNPFGLALMSLFMLIPGLMVYRRRWPGST